MKLLNVGCGTHYAQGWVNADTWETDDTKPDVKVTPGQPYPFEDNTFDAIYMGHVLEHIPWLEVSTFLKDMQRIAKPNAPILKVWALKHELNTYLTLQNTFIQVNFGAKCSLEST